MVASRRHTGNLRSYKERAHAYARRAGSYQAAWASARARACVGVHAGTSAHANVTPAPKCAIKKSEVKKRGGKKGAEGKANRMRRRAGKEGQRKRRTGEGPRAETEGEGRFGTKRGKEGGNEGMKGGR
eukprot:2707364-Pleurochrysis_carterae.AAC.1